MSEKTKPTNSTDCLWGVKQQTFDGSIVFPLCDSVTNESETYEGLKQRALFDPMKEPHSKNNIHGYGRNTNSTTQNLRDIIHVLEKCDYEKHSVTDMNNGMASIYTTLISLTSPGDRIVSIKDTYGGTSKLMIDFLPKENRECVLCETENYEEIEKETKKGCKILYIESPTNPTLKIVDIKRMAEVAHEVGAILIVDNTFASPINQNPLNLGADIVVHSATKYINGHGNAMGGFALGNKDLIRKIYDYKEIIGTGMQPNTAHTIASNIKTLGIRVKQHNKNAQAIAELCYNHPAIKDVYYPGLTTHKHHDVAKKQMHGFGGMLSFELIGDENSVPLFLDKLKYKHLAASLGHTTTLVGPPSATSHVELTKEERENLGISETLIRYSTGIEDTNDLVNDVKQALDYLYEK